MIVMSPFVLFEVDFSGWDEVGVLELVDHIVLGK
jgi:hypothetical protein